MAYTKQTWTNGSASTPISAARLNKLETQYDEAMSQAAIDAVDSGTTLGAALNATYVPHQDTAPDETVTEVWADTSTTPPTVKGWNGSTWIEIGGDTAAVDRVVTADISGTYVIDLSVGDLFVLTLTGDATISVSGLGEGRSFVVELRQDSAGGHVATLPTTYGQAVALTTVADKFDLLTLWSPDGAALGVAQAGPFDVPVGGSGGGPAALTYRANYSYDAGGAGTGTTFSTVDIGAASATREVVVVLSKSGGGTDNAGDISTFTIGGVTATLDAGDTVNNARMWVAIGRANVPSGTTADVVVTLPNTAGLYMTIGVYTSDAALSVTGSDADVSQTGASASSAVASAVDAAVLCGASAWDTSIDFTTAWTGPTEDYDLLTTAASGNRRVRSAALGVGDDASYEYTATFSTSTDNNIGIAAVCYEAA